MSDRNKLRKITKESVRCAIYTRKSTEEGLEQEFNSLDAQREAAESFIRSQTHEGWTIVEEDYNDGGFTGGNMERPGVQRLMADIATGKIDCVVVYKVDRLSRSLMDFARMIEVFDKHKVSFVSVTQQFNTGTSMGRLVLNVLLSFAQFEREIIGERIRDKICATRRKGKWCGGMPILGYDVHTNPLRIEINPTEAERVRTIFELYLEHGSMIPVVQELDRRGWVTKIWSARKGHSRGGHVYNKTRLHSLLTNVIYIGKLRYKDEINAGAHQPIITSEVWHAVQNRLAKNRNSHTPVSRSCCLLAGLLRCQPCGTAMSPSYTSKGKRRYRYYTCRNAQLLGWAKCPSKAIPAAEVERFVLQQLAITTESSTPELIPQVRQRVSRIEYDGGTGRMSIILKTEGHA